MPILKKIKNPNDLKQLSLDELLILAKEVRDEIITTCATTGGHIAPSLGVVELTLALYRVFNADRDKIIWDVGHQTYAQKLITGRNVTFHTLRTYQGISGFPKRSESKYDVFDTGHSSTSLSAATGFALARDSHGDTYDIISVIGDGSLGAGMAFEALNHIGHLNKDVIVVLNDNERSIGESVGALSQYLNRIITTRTYNRFRDDLWKFLGRFPPYVRDRGRNIAKRIQEGLKGLYAPAVIFEELGFRYIGPLNGHKLGELIDTFLRVKEMKGPRLIHVVTKKGKGYRPAEEHPEIFHGIGPYSVDTGDVKPKAQSWTEVFGDAIVRFAKQNKKIIAITAGMCLGTGLKKFREEIPERFHDVGITEQHAVTMAAALALEGYIPICAIYSTFLQRAYDQIIHDVCLQKAPVIFAVDRAGLVGADGPTHHGPFDLSYFRCIPNIIISAPKDGEEFLALLKTAIDHREGPFVIRYPRGVCCEIAHSDPAKVPIGKWEILQQGSDIAIMAIGSMVKEAESALVQLREKNKQPMLINARFAKPLDTHMLHSVIRKVKKIVTIEENTLCGGFGSAVMEFYEATGKPVEIYRLGLPDEFIEHGSRQILLKITGLDAHGIAKKISSLV
jgi:1-deoxy-D-xylulose-5-phosphate synthase